nr:unnamed protein product [Digitaria exilis]
MNVGRQHWTPGGWGSRDPHETCDGFMGRAGGFVLTVLWHCLYGHMPRQPIYDGRVVRVVGGEATGSLRIVRVVDDGDLEVLVRTHGAGECTVERKVGLCELAGIDATPDWSWGFLDVAMASSMDLVLSAFSRSTRTMEYYFSFDVENMKLQRMKKRMPCSSQTMFPYELPWPRTINACL